jgi:hypothetical protein
MLRRITSLLFWSVGLWSSVAAARYLGPTAHGYSFHASALPFEIFMSDDLTLDTFPTTATLVVHVRDVNQEPVDGVPVTFQLGSQCQGVAALSAQRAVTRNGRASVTLRTASTTGVCRIAVRVDNVTQDLSVDVSPIPDDRRR